MIVKRYRFSGDSSLLSVNQKKTRDFPLSSEKKGVQTMQQNAHKQKRAGLTVAAAFLLAASAPAALADTIQLSGWWGGAGNATIIFNGTNYHDGSQTSFTEGGGAGGFRTDDLSLGAAGTNSFQSWCVDIFHGFSFPVSRTDQLLSAASVFGSTKANDLGRLYTAHHAVIDGNGSTNDDSAAFQLAVWEIVNEKSTNPYSLSAGDLQIGSSSTGYGTAAGWLSTLDTVTSTYSANIWSVTNNQGPSGPGAQDVAIFAPIPEPETYAMLLAGLGLMGFIARRRKQREVAAA